MTSLAFTAPAPWRPTVRRLAQSSPRIDLSHMTRYRGGTYSHTVGTVVFTDGNSARTDLIRLNPNIEAYSLDFAGVAPTRPSRYDADTWESVPHLKTRAHEAEVDWILRNSYPTRSTTQLSARLRAAGYRLGTRNISEHEAIAGTQAAIWHLTNGLELDTRPLNVPTGTTRLPGVVAVEFDDDRQLAAYSATVSTATGSVLTLQKSIDGDEWEDVAASAVGVPAGGAAVTRNLGVGSTVSHSRYGRPCGGHRHYRLVVDGAAEIEDVTFQLHGSALYRNAEPVVHLYEYLLAGARAARAAAVTPELEYAAAGVDGDLVGPFRLLASDTATVAVGDALVVREDGTPVTQPLQPGESFFVRALPGTVGVTLTATIPGDRDGFGGRVITGVARDVADGRYTPLALAVPAQLVVEFEIAWGS